MQSDRPIAARANSGGSETSKKQDTVCSPRCRKVPRRPRSNASSAVYINIKNEKELPEVSEASKTQDTVCVPRCLKALGRPRSIVSSTADSDKEGEKKLPEVSEANKATRPRKKTCADEMARSTVTSREVDDQPRSDIKSMSHAARKRNKKTRSEGRVVRPRCNERENKTEDTEASKKKPSKVSEADQGLKKSQSGASETKNKRSNEDWKLRRRRRSDGASKSNSASNQLRRSRPSPILHPIDTSNKSRAVNLQRSTRTTTKQNPDNIPPTLPTLPRPTPPRLFPRTPASLIAITVKMRCMRS